MGLMCKGGGGCGQGNFQALFGPLEHSQIDHALLKPNSKSQPFGIAKASILLPFL